MYIAKISKRFPLNNNVSRLILKQYRNISSAIFQQLKEFVSSVTTSYFKMYNDSLKQKLTTLRFLNYILIPSTFTITKKNYENETSIKLKQSPRKTISFVNIDCSQKYLEINNKTNVSLKDTLNNKKDGFVTSDLLFLIWSIENIKCMNHPVLLPINLQVKTKFKNDVCRKMADEKKTGDDGKSEKSEKGGKGEKSEKSEKGEKGEKAEKGEEGEKGEKMKSEKDMKSEFLRKHFKIDDDKTGQNKK